MTVLVEQGIPGTAIYLAITVWAALRLKRLKALDRAHLPASLGLYRAAIGGALASILVAGQIADFLRLEVTIWCIVMLLVVSRLAKDAVHSGTEPAVISREIVTEPR